MCRWADRGFGGVRLRTWRIGHRIVTDHASLHEFMLATTQLRQPNHRAASSEQLQAEAKLDEMGVS